MPPTVISGKLLLLLSVTTTALLVALYASPSSAACSTVIGGGSAFADLVSSLLQQCGATCQSSSGQVPVYANVNSGPGVDAFLNGTFCSAVSATPLTLPQEKTGVVRKFGRYTLPIAIAVYGFFAGVPSATTSGTIQMSYLDTYNIYSNANKATSRVWGTYNQTTKVLTGAITPFARTAGSSTTQLVKQLWAVASNFKLHVTVDDSAFVWPGITFYSSATAICQAVTANTGAICYSQSYLCLNINSAAANRLTEIGIRNKGGNRIVYNQGTVYSLYSALPTTLPGATDSWSGVTTVFSNGPQTPPVVSLVYSFIQANGLLSSSLGAQTAKVLYWIIKLAPDQAFYNFGTGPAPPKVKGRSIAALKKSKYI